MTDTPPDDQTAPDETATPPAPHALLDPLRAALGADALESARSETDVWLRVERSAWTRTAELLRNELSCEYFSFLSGMDWQPNPNLDGEKTFTDEPKALPELLIDPSVRMAGGTSRFQVIARVQDITSGVGITVVADLDDEAPSVSSWTSVYRGADWHEREAWEMFGFDFIGHPGLRHLYLPDEFEGHPLRKDFALAARIVRPWPGLVDMEEMPAVAESSGDDE